MVSQTFIIIMSVKKCIRSTTEKKKLLDDLGNITIRNSSCP